MVDNTAILCIVITGVKTARKELFRGAPREVTIRISHAIIYTLLYCMYDELTVLLIQPKINF